MKQFLCGLSVTPDKAPHIVKEYKGQSSVETSFKILNNPMFVGPIYLKKSGRVEALAYVLLIALLIFGILERRVREAMKHESETQKEQ